MTSMVKQDRSILVVDPDATFTGTLKREAGGIGASLEIAPLAASSVSDAVGHLSDPTRAILGAFVDAGLGPRGWVPILESMNRLRLHSPAFLLVNGVAPRVTESELRALGVTALVRKPLGFGRMVRLVSPLSISRDVDAKLRALRSAEPPPCPVGADRDGEFVPVAAEALLSRSPVRTDLYVRLSSGRYFKVLHSGDFLDSDRFDTYVSGGVTHFHLRREDHARLVERFSKLMASLVPDPSVPPPTKLAVTLAYGDEVMAFLERAGVDPDTLSAAQGFVSRAFELVRSLDLRRHPLLESLMAEIPRRTHEASTALVAQLLASHVGMPVRDATETVGVAALLHDIGLLDAPPSVGGEDVSRMTLEEAHLYRAHPEDGARILAGVRGLAPEVAEAVARHHQRRDGRGFPPRKSGDRASPVAELVGAADELVRLVVAAATSGGSFDPLARMSAGILHGFSPWLAKAFREVFGE